MNTKWKKWFFGSLATSLTKSCALTSAPLRVRAVTVSMCPAAEAKCRAVRPS